jgi:regulator of ribosome biosynthesis
MAVSAAALAPSAFDPSLASSSSLIEEDCTYDLFNLAAKNVFDQRYDENEWVEDDDDDKTEGFERFLLDRATSSTTQLLEALWQLPSKPSDEGPLALLPATSYVLPRALPPPAPKEDSKWDKFAKEKGIEQRKRSRKEWDEDLGDWTVRYGKDSKHNKDVQWPIMEASKDDPYADPWAQARDAKKAKVEKNQVNQTKNLERAGVLPKGSGKKLEKEQAAKRAGAKSQQTNEVEKAKQYPAGVPVDMKSVKASEVKNRAQRGIESTKKALQLTRQSTASMGKFDKVKAGEDIKKRSSEQKKDAKKSIKEAIGAAAKGSDREVERGQKVLSQVMAGAAKKATFKKQSRDMAGGETAYDHDYDEGDNGYRKKKGRAGMGKMKKANKGMLRPKVGPGKSGKK